MLLILILIILVIYYFNLYTYKKEVEYFKMKNSKNLR